MVSKKKIIKAPVKPNKPGEKTRPAAKKPGKKKGK